MQRGIWIGDVLRALEGSRALEGGSNGNRVLELLGFQAPSVPARASGPASAPGPTTAPGGHQPDPEPREPRQPPAPDGTSRARDQRPPQSADVPLLTPVQLGPTVRTTVTGTSLPRVEEQHLSPAMPHQPLFPPRSTPAILQAALSRQVAEGPIDITSLVETVARCKPVSVVRRRYVPTLRYGVQVLVDLGPAMEPFRRDQEQVTRQIIATVGHEKVRVRYFAYSPLRGTGTGAGWTWRRPYRPPSRGTPILLLSDMGIGGPAGDLRASTYPEWLEFGRIAAGNESGIVAFVVYPPGRWPSWLASLGHPVSWDRRATARSTRTARTGP